MSAPDK